MLDEDESQGQLSRRAVAMGVGAMLLGGAPLFARAAAAENATGKADSPKHTAMPQLPNLTETIDINYAKPAPFTGEQFWTSSLALLNESFTNVITRERVELALGRKFARFSDEARSDAFLDMGKTWYFNVKYSTLHGIFEVRGMDQGDGSFSNGALLFDPFLSQSLERSGWVKFQHMYTAGLHGEPIPWVGISYRRKGKEVFFDLVDGKHVSNFFIALNRTNSDWK